MTELNFCIMNGYILYVVLMMIIAAIMLFSGGMTSQPVDEANRQKCHPSYSGACLNPNASDYDCVNGSGNGPYYTGGVRVVGPDVFGLDRDNDGWGCE
ncbi:MAG: hypothetical protein CUN55_15435 [Phototrophicales bacterium]|nr:MAG: hypothetical protein CUN55_15435 [Phototrophicales bacterium]